MGKIEICDICKKPTTSIVGKLFFSPITRTRSANSAHNNYELHLEVGACCGDRLKKSFSWTRRLTASEYHEKRRRKTA